MPDADRKPEPRSSKLFPQILVSNVVYVFALHATKELLLFYDVGVFWILMRILACGGLGVVVWEARTGRLGSRVSVEWSILGMASLLLFTQLASLLTLLLRMPSNRVIIFTFFSTTWVNSIWSPSSAGRLLCVGLALVLSFLADSNFNFSNFSAIVPAYAALLVQGVSSVGLEHTYSLLFPSIGRTFTIAATILGATVLGLPLYVMRTFLLDSPQTPAVPLFSLALLPVVAYTLLFQLPKTSNSLNQPQYGRQYYTISFPVTCALTFSLSSLVLLRRPSLLDGIVAVLMFYGIYPRNIESLGVPTKTPTARLMSSYLKTILSNSESRKIFYFLMLNMCYMLVQMLYGVWTNSLGLISDAIHMAFDCMAIGMGLFASVMATWEPNERFTYGYGRIETLSGFANGIFLILISIFIVFEAVQRLLEPPEMNTSQLLLVSSLGLAVNLFGMFAMGGHHHHGHSHSHGHGHSHSQEKDSHSHSNNGSHSHSHPGHNEPFSRAHSHSPPDHSRSQSHSHSNGHAHSQSNSHPHPHSHSDTHSHFHSEKGDHSHSHPKDDHSHSHSVDLSHSPSSSQDLSAKQRKRFSGPAIQIHFTPNGNRETDVVHGAFGSPTSSPESQRTSDVLSPLTPAYQFGHDEHNALFHSDKHVSNVPVEHNHHDDSHEGHSHNMRGVFLHVMADTLGSVGVIISTLLIQFYGWTGFDPIASLFIAILIAASVVPLVMDTGKILCLDVAERETKIQRALDELHSVEGVRSISSPRFWPKDSSKLVGSIHIQLASLKTISNANGHAGPHTHSHSHTQTRYPTELDRTIERVDTFLRSRIHGLDELTVQVDEPSRSWPESG